MPGPLYLRSETVRETLTVCKILSEPSFPSYSHTYRRKTQNFTRIALSCTLPSYFNTSWPCYGVAPSRSFSFLFSVA